jgi:hypothetical protein
LPPFDSLLGSSAVRTKLINAGGASANHCLCIGRGDCSNPCTHPMFT